MWLELLPGNHTTRIQNSMINTNLAFLHYPLAEKLGRYSTGNKGSLADSPRQKTTERGTKKREREREADNGALLSSLHHHIHLGKKLMARLFGEAFVSRFSIMETFFCFIQSKIYLSYSSKKKKKIIWGAFWYVSNHKSLYLCRNKEITSINFVRISISITTIFVLVHFEVNHMLNTLHNSKNNDDENNR